MNFAFHRFFKPVSLGLILAVLPCMPAFGTTPADPQAIAAALSGTFEFHSGGNDGVIMLTLNGTQISGTDDFPNWTGVNGEHGIKCTIAGSITVDSPGKGTITFARTSAGGMTQIYKGTWEASGGAMKMQGRWSWQGVEQGDWSASRGAVASGVLAPLTYFLEFSIDTELKSEAECKDKVDQALHFSTTLLPAGAAGKIAESAGYCKTLFPELNSPLQKVTMATFITVNTFEQCLVDVTAAKSIATRVNHWVFNHLEEVGDAKEYCLYRYTTAGGKVNATQAAAIDKMDVSNLTVSDMKLWSDGADPIAAQAQDGTLNVRVPASSVAPDAADPKSNCRSGGSWGIANPEHCIAW